MYYFFSLSWRKEILYKCVLAQPRLSQNLFHWLSALPLLFARLCHHSSSSTFDHFFRSFFSVPLPRLHPSSGSTSIFSVSPQGSRGWHLTKEQMEAPCLTQTLPTHCWTLILPHYCRMTLWSRNRIGFGKRWQVWRCINNGRSSIPTLGGYSSH